MKRKLLYLLVGVSLVAMLAALPFMAACKSTTTAPTAEVKTKTTTTTAPTAEVKTLKIGGLWSLTGWASQNDVKSAGSGQIVVDMFNEKGGLNINGQKYNVALDIEDCASSADGALAAANRLVYQKGYKFIAGGFAFFTTSAGTVAEPAKVLRCSFYNVGMPGELGPDVPYQFAGSCSIANTMVAIVYLGQAHPEVKTVVEIEPVGAFSPAVGQKVGEMLTERGIKRLGDIMTYPDEQQEFSAYAAKIVSLNPDALYSASGMAQHAGAILKAIREMGWNKLYAIGAPISQNEMLAVSGAEAATNCFTTNDVQGAPDTPATLAEFQKRTMSKYQDVSLALGYGAQCVYTLLTAIQGAKSLDPTVVKDWWEKQDTIDTLYGTGWMGGQQTFGIKHQVSYKTPVMVLDKGVGKFGGWVEVHVP